MRYPRLKSQRLSQEQQKLQIGAASLLQIGQLLLQIGAAITN